MAEVRSSVSLSAVAVHGKCEQGICTAAFTM